MVEVRAVVTLASRPWFADRLECPDCGGALVEAGPVAFVCRRCGRRFPLSAGRVACCISDEALVRLEFRARQVALARPAWIPPPDGVYRGPLPPRTNARHLSILARRQAPLDVLDWGCGTAEYRGVVRDVLGHRYVGVDAEGSGADVFADVHRLPFRVASFDHVITNAVLEHVANPFLAVREVARVMRAGGVFSGSAAFLEPHHARSHFHLAPDGVLAVLNDAGLQVQGLWPQEDWTVFDSLAAMPGPVSGPTRWLLRRLAALERRVRSRHLHPREIKARRWLAKKDPREFHEELLVVAGQIDFVAVKP